MLHWKIHFLLPILQLVIVQLHITFPSSLNQGGQCLIMVTVAWLLAHYYDVISNHNHILQVPKALLQLVLKNISCHCHSKGTTGYLNLQGSSVKSCKKGWSFIKFLVPITFLAITHRHNTDICKQMSKVLQCLKWYGSLAITLFKLVGSKQILKFKFPILFFLSTITKLLIHGVASCTGFRTPTLSILSISCWKASFKCTGIGL